MLTYIQLQPVLKLTDYHLYTLKALEGSKFTVSGDIQGFNKNNFTPLQLLHIATFI